MFVECSVFYLTNKMSDQTSDIVIGKLVADIRK